MRFISRGINTEMLTKSSRSKLALQIHGVCCILFSKVNIIMLKNRVNIGCVDAILKLFIYSSVVTWPLQLWFCYKLILLQNKFYKQNLIMLQIYNMQGLHKRQTEITLNSERRSQGHISILKH